MDVSDIRQLERIAEKIIKGRSGIPANSVEDLHLAQAQSLLIMFIQKEKDQCGGSS